MFGHKSAKLRLLPGYCALLCFACTHPALGQGWALPLALQVRQAGATATPAVLALTSEEGAEWTLSLTPRQLQFSRRTPSGREVIWQAPSALVGQHYLLLRYRGQSLTICLDHQRLTDLPLALPSKLRPAFSASTEISADGAPRLQRLGRIYFTDDFARARDAGLQWSVAGGRFVIASAGAPDSSQGAFELWGSAPASEAVAVADGSYWFWDNYRAGVAIRADRLPVSAGLICDYVDPETYHLIRWHQPQAGPGTLELVRRRGGLETVVAATPLRLQCGQWYRLTALIHDGAARVFVSGQELLTARDATLTGGRVGLYLRDTAGVLFDDVAVSSIDAAAFAEPLSQPFGPSEQEWSDFRKKAFIGDSFMAEWSQPKKQWSTDEDGRHWFRARLFRDATVSWQGAALPSWPATAIEIGVFAGPDTVDSGYRLIIAEDAVTLSKAGTAVARAAVVAEPLTSIRFSVANGTVDCAINQKRLLWWRDEEPIGDGQVVTNLSDLDGLRVTSSHRLDYNFDFAPTAWAVQSGDFHGTNRWACVPKWSFFAGRGDPGPPGISHGNATLWNRRRFAGDFDFEVFVAPLEGTPQQVHFDRPVTQNLAFAADGQNLDSGYMLLFGTYDVPTRLYRRGVEVAVWHERVDLDLRRQHLPWYHRLSNTWQHLRVMRVAGRVTVDIAAHDDHGRYQGLERAIDYLDPEPLNGDRIGLWTWGANGIAVARATISFADSPGPAALPGFSGTLDQPGISIESVTAAVGGTGPQSWQSVCNRDAGGAFAMPLNDGSIDLALTNELSFSARIPAEVRLTLQLSIRGQVAEIAITDPPHYREQVIPLAAAESTALGDDWRRFQVELSSRLRAIWPTGRLIVDRAVLASPYGSVEEIAGLGVNHCGACYDLADVAWQLQPLKLAAVPAAPTTVTMGDHRPLIDFEGDAGDWACLGGWDGAAVYRDDHEPHSGRYALRLLNTRMAGPAGAWITRHPFSLPACPTISFDYRVPDGVAFNLIVKANHSWFEVALNGKETSWPLIGELAGFTADGTWRHASFDLFAALREQLATDSIVVQAMALADTSRMSSGQGLAYWIDNFCTVPAIAGDTPTTLTVGIAGGEAVAYSHLIDDQPQTLPPMSRTGTGSVLQLTAPLAGRFLHVAAEDAQGNWHAAAHLPLSAGSSAILATQPEVVAVADEPPPPIISYIPSDRLCRDEFEWGRDPEFPEQHFDEVSIRRSAWALQNRADAATGSGCVELVNLVVDEFYSVFLRRSAWDPERWPMVSFDYRFAQAGCGLNLSLLVNGSKGIITWTHPDQPGVGFVDAVIGQAPRAEQDGRWHHLEVDLQTMLTTTRFPDAATRPPLQVAQFATWAAPPYSYHNPVGARLMIDNFTIYSRRDTTPSFEWRTALPVARIKGYAHAFDHQPETIPGESITTIETGATYPGTAPGRWYLHVRTCDIDGRWGPTAHAAVTLTP